MAGIASFSIFLNIVAFSRIPATRLSRREALHLIAPTPEAMKCVCKPGRCEIGERGHDGELAMETQDMDCCKFRREPSTTNGLWVSENRSSKCINRRANEIENAFKRISGNSDRCNDELHAFYLHLTKWAKSDGLQRKLHGTSIVSFCPERLAEKMVYDWFVPPKYELQTFFFAPSVPVFAHLFRIEKRSKLLWSGTQQSVRVEVKHVLEAGELSRGDDTDFAKIVDHPDIGQLRNCDVKEFWRIASKSFAAVDEYLPFVVLVNKSMDELRDTAFWLAEIPGLADLWAKAPSWERDKNLHVITFSSGPDCATLMPEVRKQFEYWGLPGWNQLAMKRRWKTEARFTCQSGADDLSNVRSQGEGGEVFPPPFDDVDIEAEEEKERQKRAAEPPLVYED